MTVVQYINKQGGTRSPSLCCQAWHLWQVAIKYKISLKAAYIARKLNILPDQLSRFQIQPTEWTLSQCSSGNILSVGLSEHRSVVSKYNHKTPVFCAWIPIQLPNSPWQLQQPRTGIFHPNPAVFNLTALMLSTDSLEQRAFLVRLQGFSQQAGNQVPRKTILPNLGNSVAGVIKGKLISIQHL